MPDSPNMAKQHALVVDDSRSARETLKRMLEKHNLEVDTLESAPEALEYLTDNTPDVIFMDIMMPDMDGFEAVEAIKGNPDTATIPIMMYTSKEGDLYVSQARALGAIGILPKHVEPAELFEVLNSLGLARDRRHRPERRSPVVLSADSDDIHNIAHQAAAAVGSSHGDSAHSDEMLDDLYRKMHEGFRGVQAEIDKLSRARALLLPLTVFLVMLVPLIWLYSQNLETHGALEIARQDMNELVESHRQLQDRDMQTASLQAQLDDRDSSAYLQAQQLYSSIAWAINLSSAYDPEEVAFSDRRLTVVQELLTRLTALGFTGTVQLESHIGDFCLTGDDVSGYRPAGDNIVLADCDLIGHPDYQLPTLGERQSIGFANFMSTSPLINGGDIRLELVNYQNNRPRVPYPPQDSALTAREWNRIAAANHRVEVTLVPDAP